MTSLTTTDIEFVENPIRFNFEFRSVGGTVGRFMVRTTKEAGFRARQEAPRPGKLGTGRTRINYSKGVLAASIVTFTTTVPGARNAEVEGRVIAVPKHAIYVHEGTRRHTIRPKRAPRLVFFWARKGRVVSLKKVEHPGTPANPFLVRALRKTMRGI